MIDPRFDPHRYLRAVTAWDLTLRKNKGIPDSQPESDQLSWCAEARNGALIEEISPIHGKG